MTILIKHNNDHPDNHDSDNHFDHSEDYLNDHPDGHPDFPCNNPYYPDSHIADDNVCGFISKMILPSSTPTSTSTLVSALS